MFQDIRESFGFWPMRAAIIWRSPTEIYQTTDAVIIVIELAGVKDDMPDMFFGDLFAVAGTRELPLTDMNACHQLEIKYGNFMLKVAIHTPGGPRKCEGG